MKSISDILVGETTEITCFRAVRVETTISAPAKERLLALLIRKALRRPAPTKVIPWTDTKYEQVGQKLWVIGTEDGPVAREASPYPEDV